MPVSSNARMPPINGKRHVHQNQQSLLNRTKRIKTTGRKMMNTPSGTINGQPFHGALLIFKFSTPVSKYILPGV